MTKLTPKQLDVLVNVWPLIRSTPRPNCGQLLRHMQTVDRERWRDWSQLRHYMRELKKKGIVMSKLFGTSVLWEPGPVSDWLQEQGVLE